VLYHRTENARAHTILRSGFGEEDEVSAGLVDLDNNLFDFGGVRLSDKALDENEGASGGTVLAVSIPPDDAAVLDDYEATVEGSPYREWFVPPSVLNAHAQVRICERNPSPPIWQTRRGDDLPPEIERLDIG
jgi:hypothetical protein